MHLTFANIIHILTNISIVMLRLCRSEVMPIGIVKLSVPHIVSKAHFTHEVRFTCEEYFTFRLRNT